jgi:hypothetical protein
MKKLISIILFFLPITLLAQSINKVEYFWDTDPGVGLAIPLILNPPSDTINFGINTGGLAIGIHTLYVRTHDSSNHNSLSEGRTVNVNQSIVAAEYFWDTDPGVGLGISLAVTGAPVDSVNFSPTVSTIGLSMATHLLYVRTKDNSNTWSLSEPRTVNIIPAIVAAEYFWDTDPGVGLGTSLAVTGAPVDSASFSPAISTTGLSMATHFLYVRTKDNSNRWSLSEPRAVTVIPSIVAAEYFWDTDPGIGLGISIGVTGAPVDSANFSPTVSTTGLSMATHLLYVRTKDNSNKWSLSEPRAVTVIPSIVAAEYFWDTDPGIGLGISIAITGAPVDSANFSPVISTTGLSMATHSFYVRTKDNSNKWSLSEPRAVKIIPGIVAAEYFIDVDPGVGLALPVSVPGAPNDSVNFNFSLPISSLTLGVHNVYIRTKDNSNKWSLSEPRQFFIGTCSSTIIAGGPTTFCAPDSVTLIASSGSSYLWSTGETTGSIIANATGTYYCAIKNSAGCLSNSNSIVVTENVCNVTLNLKLFIEALYIPSTGRMAQKLQFLSSDTTACDSITVELHDVVSPYSVIASASLNVLLHTDGTSQVIFPGAVLNHSYYLVIRHYNSIETWSKNPVSFNASIIAFDFTSP